jgi:hypothetical protein
MTFAMGGARMKLAALLIVIPLLAGCAHLPVATTASGAQAPPSAAAVDSGPSPDANAVLATIPEPLAQGQKVAPATPAPGESPARAPIPATAAGGGAALAAGAATGAHDTASVPGAVDTAVIVPADTVRADVPVPAPTQPLKPAPTIAAGALIATQAPPPPPAPEKTAPAEPDTCWRLQVGAPGTKDEAEKMRKAAASQLLVPFVVEYEKQRYKIRTQDCLDATAVEAMRQRAKLAGFPEAFRVRGRIK